MKRLIVLLAFALVVVSFGTVSPAAASSARTTSAARKSGLVPGQYIVTLTSGVKPAAFLTSNGIAARYVYDAALNGFAAELNQGQLTALAHNPNVARIEQDQYVSVDATQSNPTWGLDRIDQRDLPLSNSYSYFLDGSLVTAYIIDTGIQFNHPNFGSRASIGYDAVGDGFMGYDCNGHGTHVAGTIGSSTYGVAKGVKLVGVRVLDCNGNGTTAQVIAGVNWVTSNHSRYAVANLSLGGGANSSLDAAVTTLVSSGVTTVVAAGNNNADACNYSPARASGVLTVAASDKTDAKASFSNYGSCVELYAPGKDITSTWIGSAYATASGTSMASPHVAGVAALVLSFNPSLTPAMVGDYILINASQNKISGNVSGTPNLLLYRVP